MSIRYLIGDVFDRMAELEDDSVDLILTSPPFLALRSYLPADHPDKSKEIGSEATPAEYIDVLLGLTAEWRRLLAPHGSLVVELGDTYSGSGGAGGDYAADGLRDGQPKFRQAQDRPQDDDGGYQADQRVHRDGYRAGIRNMNNKIQGGGPGWPLAKSLTLIPESYRWALVYGFNPFRGPDHPSPAGQWRARNVVRWVRPNPPVGALGDKFRPATSELVVACTSKDRWFDLDAVRGDPEDVKDKRYRTTNGPKGDADPTEVLTANYTTRVPSHPAGAPPLDWWKISPKGYSGKTSTTVKQVVDPDEFSGDMNRTTSEDCPKHAGLPDSVATESDDEPPTDGQSYHTSDNTDPVQGQLLDSAPTDQPPELLIEDESSGSLAPVYVPAANPRNKASNKTGLAPETNLSDTASYRSSDHTDDKSASRLSDEPHPDMTVSRTDEPDPSSLDHKTADDIAHKPDEPSACTCTYFVWDTNFTSHYAVWPSELCVKPIKAMCPREVCWTCGQPRRRIVGEVEYVKPDGKAHSFHGDGWETNESGANRRIITGADNGIMTRQAPTLGWSDCGHDDFRPGMVLDPFAGTGTTLAVAHGHGRDAIGIDIDSRSAELARDRVGPLFLEIEHA